MNLKFSPLQSLADIATGTGMALINDWPILIANLVIIAGRILLEWLILKKQNRKGKRQS